MLAEKTPVQHDVDDIDLAMMQLQRMDGHGKTSLENYNDVSTCGGASRRGVCLILLLSCSFLPHKHNLV